MNNKVTNLVDIVTIDNSLAKYNSFYSELNEATGNAASVTI